MSEYSQWEEAVVALVAEKLEITHSDAEGVVQAQDFYMVQSWGKGMNAEETAEKVISESTK
ncbi:hypothetical protein [Pseudomonas guariconensis]|uniref:hypothetical protein n=1 Tax=Pseudomonas guariconensis TaxID=1288410 RepID=UPI0039063FC0